MHYHFLRHTMAHSNRLDSLTGVGAGAMGGTLVAGGPLLARPKLLKIGQKSLPASILTFSISPFPL